MFFYYFDKRPEFSLILLVTSVCYVSWSNLVTVGYETKLGCIQKNYSYPKVNTQNIPPRPNKTATLIAKPDPFETSDPTTQAKVTFRQDLFTNDNGNIIYYAFLLAQEVCFEKPINGTWNETGSSKWPSLPNWKCSNTSYQVTPPRWNPFKNYGNFENFIHTSSYILGDGECYEDGYCNTPLNKKTKYAFKIRAFTSTEFQDTDIIFFETLDNLNVKNISLILGGLFAVTFVAVCLSIFNFDWVKAIKMIPGKTSKDSSSPVPEAISQKSFLKYAEDLLKTQGRLGNEFHLLGTLSSDVSTLCLHGQRVDNRKKNRYGNILPFDMTRVKLSVIDDDPSTDYINASFIKGYTQEVEYIASQAPKEETCHDFYRMIIEQNIEMIVMLTNLSENDVEKCYKYYPDNGKVMTIRGITIICKGVEEFEFYTKRNLTIVSSSKTLNVTQLHFTKWKDFDCPENTDNIIELCELIHKNPQKGHILVHCSAGVGRTGTFIAIDILLQEVKHGNKISVFHTVLKLRQQRPNMVQTDAQLGFIYRCVVRAIESSLTRSKETH